MPGWGANRFATLTDTRSSSTDESVGFTQSAPALSRKENSCESAGSSKFAEAMKNPNWRRRHDLNGSLASTETELNYDDYKADEYRKDRGANLGGSHEGAAPLTARSGFRKSDNLPVPWDFITHYADSGLEHKVNETDIENFRNSSNARDDAPDPLPRDTGVYQLVRRMDLPGIQCQGKAVSIFELAPVETERQDSLHQSPRDRFHQLDLVRVQKFDREAARIHGEGQSHKLPAIRVPIPVPRPAWPQNGEAECRQASSASVEKARKAVFEDPAVADVGLSRQVPSTNAGQGREQVPPSSFRDQTKPTDSLSCYLTEKNIAFNKMLQKLYKGSGQRPKSHESREKGQVFASRHADRTERTLTQKLPPRKPDSTDSGLGSMDASLDAHCKESSRDSAVSADSPQPSTRLNPRAREFLCLGFSSPNATGQGPSHSDDQQAGRDQHLRPHDSAGSKQSSEDTLPPTGPLPIMNSSQGFQQLSGNMSPGLIGPLGFMLPPGFAPSFGLTPGQTLTPTPCLPPPGLGLIAVPFNTPGAVATNQLPPAAYATPPITAPFSSVSAQGMLAAPPPPVPKPRKPDPANQQAYEAYLEWRKANEPGYALECRQRQQRRAQRQLNARSKLPHSAQPEIAAKS